MINSKRRAENYVCEEDYTMQVSYYKFYVRENQRIHDRLIWEWLLEQASTLGFRGGSAFRAIAGFGRHQHLHEALSFDLTGAPAVVVEFVVTDEEAQKLLAVLGREQLRLLYARMPAQLGVSSADDGDSAT
jgi:PII-like signaling protein